MLPALVALCLASCATHPARIAPQPFPRGAYVNLSCQELDKQLLDDRIRLSIHEGRQDIWHRNDRGVALIGSIGAVLVLPLFAFLWLDGNGADAAQVARLKGKVAEMQREFTDRCPPRRPPQTQ